MAEIYHNVLELIGETPLMRLNRWEKACGAKAAVFAKLEFMNPTGSVKDRVGKNLLLDAQRRGLIKPGATIVEPTSGNTGIGLAAACAVLGYRVILTMPDSMSPERITLLKAYGAEIVLTEGSRGMAGAIEKAEELQAAIENSFIPAQFDNSANPQAHYLTTGPEIWRDSGGAVDIFVACVGTGGTVTGVGRYLKEQKPEVKIVAVEPLESPLLTKGQAGSHGIQGIGANFVPSVLDRALLDEVIDVSTKDAYAAAAGLPKLEGLLVGISAGAALCAAGELACRAENAGRNIVVLLPDTGERYLSTGLFSEAW